MPSTSAETRAFADLLTERPPVPTGAAAAVTCEPGWSWRFSALGDFDLWAVRSGRGRAEVDGHLVDLAAGTVLLIRPRSVGWAQQDAGQRLRVHYCHFVLPTPPSGAVGAPSSAGEVMPAVVSRLAPDHQVFTLLGALTRSVDDHDRLAGMRRENLLRLVLLELWQSGHGRPRRRDPRVTQVMTGIREEPGRRWTLSAAAALAHLSPPHFSRLFTAETGTSFRDFCLRVRLERARQLLLETPMTVTEVARALGYPDVYLFSRQVRARFGVPPSGLRGTPD